MTDKTVTTPELSEYGEKFMREELMRRTRPFPKGWTLKTIESSNHGFGYRCVLDGGNRTQWAYGRTPDAALVAAIKAVGGTP